LRPYLKKNYLKNRASGVTQGVCPVFKPWHYKKKKRKKNPSTKKKNRKDKRVRHWWLTPVILAIQETEIRRMEV
jgi:hypothetical protein